MQQLTVLTSPISRPKIVDFSYNILRFFRSALLGRFEFALLKYGGHYAVTRSLVEGLGQLKIEFNYNPKAVSEVYENVVALSGVEALVEAINLKKLGKIKRLFAGPNVMELPGDYDNLLASSEIDAVLVPSQMTLEIYERLNPYLKGRVKIWYAGVDAGYWKLPAPRDSSREVLVYWKNPPSALGVYVEKLLVKYNFVPSRIVYGKYAKREYKKMLANSAFAVFLSITETQGLGLAEAWAMDIPTLVWNPRIEHYYIKNLQTTAAPYLSAETGREWKDFNDLESLLNAQSWRASCRPRQWVLQNMTDEQSAKLLIKFYD